MTTRRSLTVLLLALTGLVGTMYADDVLAAYGTSAGALWSSVFKDGDAFGANDLSQAIGTQDAAGDINVISASNPVPVETPAGSEVDVDVQKLGGQAINLGAGAVDTGTQRMTLASDDPAVVDLAALEVLSTAANVDLAAIEVLQTTIAADTTSIDAKLPASLGATAPAGSLSVVQDTTGSWTVVEASGATIAGDTTSLDTKIPTLTLGGGVEAGALLVTVASDSTGVLSVDDGGGDLSIDDGGNSITTDINGFSPGVAGALADMLRVGGLQEVGSAPRTFKTANPFGGERTLSNSERQVVVADLSAYDTTDGNADLIYSTGQDTHDARVGLSYVGTTATAVGSGAVDNGTQRVASVTSSTNYAVAEAQVSAGAEVVVGASVTCDAVGACSITLREVWDGDCDAGNAAQVNHLMVGAPVSSTGQAFLTEPFAADALCVDQAANVAAWSVVTR